MLVDLRVAQLLCSRLCHDLAGPVGAVNAGLELLEESVAKGDDALHLVGCSADQIRCRLAFLRLAFGLGTTGGSTMELDAVRSLSADLLNDGGVTLDWAPYPERAVSAAGAKLLLNLILLGVDCLPRGGTLGVRFADLPEGLGVALTAAGHRARLTDIQMAALVIDAPADELSAQNIHAHLATRLAQSLGVAIEVSTRADGAVQLAVLVPDVAG